MAQSTMRGVIRTGRRRVEVRDVMRPRVESGTAVVRVLASGICGSDLHGYRENDAPEERPSGHEVAGVVVDLVPSSAADSAPARMREGDLVTIDTICLGRACGECRWCAEGAPFHCQRKRSGPDWSGAFAEYIKRDVRGIFPLAAGMQPSDGALVEPLAVAVHALRVAALRLGESVAVIGAGTIGLTCVVAAAAMGAGAVFVLARHPHQAESATALGAAGTFTGTPEEAEQAILDATGGNGADVVVETVGGEAPTVNQAWRLVRRRGRVAVLGVFTHAVPIDLGKPLGKEVTVHFPVCYGEIDGRHDYDIAIELIASGRAPVSRLLSHTLPLAEAQRAFDIADDKSSRSIKVQLAP